MREIPKPGQIYRHFKGHLYQITAIARHSETLEALVIYQALYGDFQYYARPLHMFMDELDKEKYSGVKQRDRFELVRTVMDEIELEPTVEVAEEPQETPKLDSGLEEFLDADTYEEKMRIFTGMQHRLTDDMINVMAISMDTEVPEGTLEDRVSSLKSFLLMQVKFECNRVR
jgi:hypothetical protein